MTEEKNPSQKNPTKPTTTTTTSISEPQKQSAPLKVVPVEIPKSELQQPQAAAPVQPIQNFWDNSTTELLIGTMSEVVKILSVRAGEIINNRKAVLASATTPVLNKHFPTGGGVELMCAIAWGGVALEILQEVRKNPNVKPTNAS